MGGPGPADDRGFAALDPEDARRFAGRVDDLERTVAEAREALRRLAEDPLATGTGQENAEMASSVRRAVVEGTAAWEEADRTISRFGRSRPVIPPYE